MGKLSIDSIPLRYSAYFLLASDSWEKPKTHLEKNIDYFVDADGRLRQRWFQLHFSYSSLFKGPEVVIRKQWEPKAPPALTPKSASELAEKPSPEWARPGACLLPTCFRGF